MDSLVVDFGLGMIYIYIYPPHPHPMHTTSLQPPAHPPASTLRDQNTSIPHLPFPQPLKRPLNPPLTHRKRLNDRPDTVQGRKLQHLAMHRSRRHEASLDTHAVQHDGHVGDREIAAGDGEGVDGGAGGEDGLVHGPVGLCGCGDQEAVDGFADTTTELFEALRGVEFRSAECHRFLLFVVGAAEDDDLAAHFAGELDGQVAETADADDADSLCGPRVVHLQRVEDGRAAALEGGGVFAGDGRGGLEEEGFAPDGVGG